MKNKKIDKIVAGIFIILTIVFILLAAVNKNFFDWMFARHQNVLSWYIRPIFLIPFCYFAYKRSFSGIFSTVFLLLTSMFWFPAPFQANIQVQSFLAMEKEYLTGSWNAYKILITLLVPLSLSALALAFWKRSLWIGIPVLVFIAVAKMVWSVAFGSSAGTSVIAPAVIGLAVCIALVIIGFRKLEKKKSKKQ